jgi:hypothetical protein
MKGYKKHKKENWIVIINDDNSHTSIKKGCGKLWDDYQAHVDNGGAVQPHQTPSEKKSGLLSALKNERDKRIKEADKWELPTILKRYNITIEQVETYKQVLCDMPDTHTTTEQLENPDWPEKLIQEELL